MLRGHLQAAKLVFQRIIVSLGDEHDEKDRATVRKIVMQRDAFQASVLYSVKELTEKAVGDVDLQIACK